jgi:archaellum biogenesis ATPase FlaH
MMTIVQRLATEGDRVVRVDPITRDADSYLRTLLARVEAGDTGTNAITTGIPWLDERLGGGWYRGENYLLFGYSGRGKSLFGTQIGYAAALAGFKVVKFSLEMRAEKDIARFYARRSEIPTNVLLRKPWLLSQEQLTDFMKDTEEWKDAKRIYEVRSYPKKPTMAAIEAELLMLPFDPDLVIIDQLTDIAATLDWKDIALAAESMQLLAKSWKQEKGLALVAFGQAAGKTKFDKYLTQDDFKYGRAPTEWCTAVLYLSQTEEDFEDKTLNLGFAKDRDGEAGDEQMVLYPRGDIGRIHCWAREAKESASNDNGLPV